MWQQQLISNTAQKVRPSDHPKVNSKIPERYRTGTVTSVVSSVHHYYGLYLKGCIKYIGPGRTEENPNCQYSGGVLMLDLSSMEVTYRWQSTGNNRLFQRLQCTVRRDVAGQSAAMERKKDPVQKIGWMTSEHTPWCLGRDMTTLR